MASSSSKSHSAEERPARLSPLAKLRLAGEILTLYGRVRRRMGRDDLPSVVKRLRTGRPEASPPSRASRFQLGAVVMRLLSVLPTDSPCLTQSLVLLGLLERRGAPSTLVIGVAPEPEFAAHAWIEFEGEPLLPSGDGQFSRLVEI